jgi:hypothetical protein
VPIIELVEQSALPAIVLHWETQVAMIRQRDMRLLHSAIRAEEDKFFHNWAG